MLLNPQAIDTCLICIFGFFKRRIANLMHFGVNYWKGDKIITVLVAVFLLFRLLRLLFS